MTDKIIFLCLAALILLALVSFGVNPAYEKGVWAAFAALGVTLSTAVGAKFGMALPKPMDEPTRPPAPSATRTDTGV